MTNKIAIWRVSIVSRGGIERELGKVLASTKDMHWIKSFPTLSCDIIERLPCTSTERPPTMADYEIIHFVPGNAPRYQPTAAEIWQQMIVGTISPALAQIRLAQLTNWPGSARTSPSARADEGA